MSEILKCEEITKKFGGLTALNKVSFNVDRGEIFGIIGPNGSGKTTLLNVITGLLKPEEGRILLDSKDITNLKPHERVKLGIARMFQGMRVFPYLPVYLNVELVARAVYGDVRLARAKTSWALTMSGLLPEAGELPAKLTPYKLRMLEFARILVSNPKVALLDEPFAGLTSGEA
ncbi:MAG: ATP-binding cassette domain-containing protein, partial [Zestosphaera sp.]